jgi:hypothetical protein
MMVHEQPAHLHASRSRPRRCAPSVLLRRRIAPSSARSPSESDGADPARPAGAAGELPLLTSLATGALCRSAAFRIARTTWSAPVNRIAHSFAWYLPFCLAVFVALYPGRSYYLPWIGRDLGDLTSWLNVPFVFLRNGLGLFLVMVLAFAYVRIYLRVDRANVGRPVPEDWQGESVEVPGANRALSIVGVALLYLWAFELSILGLDFAMSLTIGWYSSLFPWYFLLGSAYSGVAALAVMAVALRKWLGVPGLIGKVPRRYLGNFVLAFAMAMTYFFYSQALPIWYENLPKEILFIIPRLRITPWLTVCWVIVFTTYLGVFFLFIVREMREIPATLVGVSLLALAGLWLERYMLVVPSLTPRAPLSPLLVGSSASASWACARPHLRHLPGAPSGDEPPRPGAEGREGAVGMRLPPLLRRRWIAIAWTAAALAGAGAFVYLAVILLGPYPVGPEQPIPISHRVHADTRQISCLFCHDTADRSADAGMPGTEKCLLCHHIIIHNFPPIRTIHEQMTGTSAVPWVRATASRPTSASITRCTSPGASTAASATAT